MKCIGVQMIDNSVSCQWWKAAAELFVKENDILQIRCWNEELAEIDKASKYGTAHIEGNETCINGVVSREFIDELGRASEPTDKTIYNKMTDYFTINTSNGANMFESSHYGTELYIVTSSEMSARFLSVMEPYADSFSISVTDV